MKTYILIPIKDIEELNKRYTPKASWEHVVGNLIYENGKQISLDEKELNLVMSK